MDRRKRLAGAQLNWIVRVKDKLLGSVKFDSSPDKIERWGFCRKTCTDQRDSFMNANMNLLTDEECNTLFRQVNV